MTWRIREERDRFGLIVFACDQCHRLAVGASEYVMRREKCVCASGAAGPRRDTRRVR